jgi:uncharacterized protein
MASLNGNYKNLSFVERPLPPLLNRHQPEQVWLFGSHAWGTPDESSDLDLMVLVGESAERPVRRAQRAHRCLKGLGIAKDILVKTRAELDRFRNVPASLEAEILSRGRLIYG